MIYRHQRSDVRQEEDRVPRRPILLVLGVTIVLAFAMAGWGWATTNAEYRALRPSGRFTEETLEKPHAVSQVVQDLYDGEGEGEVVNAQKEHELESWGWVDKKRGIAHIPIEEAITVIAEQGKP